MRAYVVDLLSQTPFYDKALCNALATAGTHVAMFSIPFRHEPDFWSDTCFEVRAATRPPDPGRGAMARAAYLLRKALGYERNWRALLESVVREQPDVVHVQWAPMAARPCQIGERRFIRQIMRSGVPVVYTAHNLRPHDSGDRAARRFEQLYREVSAVIVHTEGDREGLRALGVPRQKVHLVPQGPVHLERPKVERAEARRALGWREDAFICLMLGVIRPYKGIEEAIAAVNSLPSKPTPPLLVIRGNALSAKYVRRLRRMAGTTGEAGRVTLEPGYVASQTTALMHDAADVILFPYRAISQSGAFLTAAGRGCCVVAHDGGGIGECLREGRRGILTGDGGIEGIARSLMSARDLGLEGRSLLGSHLAKWVEAECSWSRIGAETLGVYRSVQDRRGVLVGASTRQAGAHVSKTD
ncbi:MAG: glycosyltransferase family 4 protein [Thermoanaerobaculia bacterium]